MILELLLLIFLIFLVIRSKQREEDPRIPKGPRGLPLLGNISLFTGPTPHKNLAIAAKDFGPMMRVKLGMRDTIVINDWDCVVQVFGTNGTNTFARPPIYSIDYLTQKKGIVDNSNNEQWKFVRSQLHTMFLQKEVILTEKLQTKIKGEVDLLLNKWEKMCNENPKKQVEFNVENDIKATLVNIAGQFLFSGRFTDVKVEGHKDKTMADIVDAFFNVGVMSPVDAFPVLEKILPVDKTVLQVQEYHRELSKLFKRMREEHEPTVDYDNPRDMTDLTLAMKNKEPEMFTDRDLDQIMIDIVVAGVETIANSTQFGIYLLSNHLNVQQRLRNEIEGLPSRSVEEIQTLPYFEAVFKEVARMYPAAPIGLGHTAAKDLEVAGFLIPANYMLFANYYAISRDPKQWESPDSFNPDRFLRNTESSTGSLKRGNKLLNQHFVFGAGMRKCIGADLANTEFKTIMSRILDKFELHPPAGGFVMEEKTTVALSPMHGVQCMLKLRQ